ncbi:tripartite motif-containing 13 [Denticeps clupeoides]|uniref:Uncharacterized protein n=1 Tax=Denticeps clupeoides TaxID=299321 RepID=A0AAY4BJI8_9TELE|nr:E3 ubiquitin-protein ligase TRIM13 [Denticeps clupeoides]
MTTSVPGGEQLAPDAMELLEEDLTCPICCCLFEDPRVLPCSHSFCRTCLDGVAHGGRPPLRCPTCRQEAPHGGAANRSLRGVADKFRRVRGLPRPAPCPAHRGQPLNIFCATDLRLICGFCATAADHDGHRFCALEDAHARERDAFDALRAELEGWRGADAGARLQELEGRREAALRLVGGGAQRAADYLDRRVRALEHRRAEVLSDFEALRLRVARTYEPEIARLRAALEERRRALALAESLRALSDPLAFLQQMQDFRERLRVIRDAPPPPRTPTRAAEEAGALARDFDVTRWDSVTLGELDALRAPHESAPGVSLARALATPLALAACLCVLVAALLPPDRWPRPRVPSAAELARHAARCWTETAALCALAWELGRGCVLDLVHAGADFLNEVV